MFILCLQTISAMSPLPPSPLLPTLPDIARVQTIKILGVTISDCLSVSQHVTNVIASIAQTFHALRFTGPSSSWTEQRRTRWSFQGSCYSGIDVCMPHLEGIHHGSRPAENGSSHPPWSTFWLLPHQAPLAKLVATADETLRTFFTINSMYSINCCRTERSQPTTLAQENMTVHSLKNIQ